MRTNPISPRRILIRLSSAAAGLLLLTLTACGSSDDGDDGKVEPATKSPPTSSAPAPSPRPGDQEITVEWQGEQRLYRVHAPPDYTPGRKLPLVIAMHAYPSDGTYVSALSGLDDKADQEGFLVAYPDGLDRGYNAFICCGAEDDIGFIRTMVRQFTDDWGADPKRVYATGISNGGDMSFKLAVELSDTLAAIAPVSGGFIGDAPQEDDYKPTSPVSVMTFIGGQDQYYDQFDEGVKLWQQRLGCKAAAAKTLAGKVTRTTADCADGSEVVTYRLPTMGHSWPGGRTPPMAESVGGIDATELMWDFFAAHPKQ